MREIGRTIEEESRKVSDETDLFHSRCIIAWVIDRVFGK